VQSTEKTGAMTAGQETPERDMPQQKKGLLRRGNKTAARGRAPSDRQVPSEKGKGRTIQQRCGRKRWRMSRSWGERGSQGHGPTGKSKVQSQPQSHAVLYSNDARDGGGVRKGKIDLIGARSIKKTIGMSIRGRGGARFFGSGP